MRRAGAWFAIGCVAAALALTTCRGGDSAACSASCPPVEGIYTVVFDTQSLPNPCPELATLPGNLLTVTRTGSEVTLYLEEQDPFPLVGTAYDDGEIVASGTRLLATGGADHRTLTAQYQASAGGQPGDGTLTGILSLTVPGSPDGGSGCTRDLAFTAFRFD